MNQTIETLVTTRRSCRAYTTQQVEPEKLEQIVEAGRYAPTGGGRQPVHFVVVQDPETVTQLSRMNAAVLGKSDLDPFYGAPTVIEVLVDANVGTCVEDGALAMGNLMNAAASLGVDSCWIHRAKEMFESEEGLALLAKWGLPADGSLRGVGNCILGYRSAPLAEPAPRKDNVTYVK